MDLDFTSEQEMLRDTAKRLFAEQSTVAIVRAMEDHPVGYPPELWKQMGDLGLTGLMLPEEFGGGGQTAIEGAILYEELGRSLAPTPHFVSAAMSGGAITVGGSPEQQAAWLPKIASGDVILTPAWLEPQRGFGPRGVALEAIWDGATYRLTGIKRHVAFASSADRFLVLARTGTADHEVDLFLVDPKSPGVTCTQQRSLASDTQYEVVFQGVKALEADRIGKAGTGWATWHRVMLDGIILLAAQAMGGAQRALDMTVQYAKERYQFDKALGAFQALAHYMADATTAIDGGTTLAYEAAWARAAGRRIDRLAPMAKLFACQTFRNVTATGQQIYGGMGFTIECDIQLYFRRAKQLQMTWWDSRYLEDLIARDALDGANQTWSLTGI